MLGARWRVNLAGRGTGRHRKIVRRAAGACRHLGGTYVVELLLELERGRNAVRGESPLMVD